MKKLTILLVILLASTAYAAMTQRIIVLNPGETINLKNEVPWPVATAWAHLDPPASTSGGVTRFISFAANGDPVIVTGPTTITLEYGSLDPPPSPDPVTTPDAIGGGGE